MSRAEQIAAVLSEFRERMFRSEFRANGEERGYVIASDIAQTVWRDLSAALDAALAAQEGERGGVEVAAAVEAAALAKEAEADSWDHPHLHRPDTVVRLRREAAVIRAALADPAGVLAKHDAEVWDEGYRAGVHDEATSQDWTNGTVPPNRRNPYRADRIAGGQP